LSREHGDELAPAIERAKLLPDVMLASQGFEFMSLEKSNHLMKDCVTMGHGSDLLVNTGVLANSV
jgi:hypothetical protein